MTVPFHKSARSISVWPEFHPRLPIGRTGMPPEYLKANNLIRIETQVYLSTCPRKKRLRLVPFSRMISAFSINAWIVDQKSAAFTAGEILGLVKTLGCHAANRAQPAIFILSKQAVRVVFHHRDAMTAWQYP